MKIFLSHRSERKPLVREFKGKLPGFLNTWLDEESLAWGDTFPDKLKRTITSEVDFLIIFLDNDTLSSKWVTQELEWAIQRERELKRAFILPIVLPEVSSESLPAGFSDRLSLRLSDFEKDSMDELAKKAVIKLFQLVVESYSDTHQYRKTQRTRQTQLLGQRPPAELRDDEIKILLELMRAKEEPGPNYIRLLELSELVGMRSGKVDYFLRKLEDAGLVFTVTQDGETMISSKGIEYLVENNKM